MKIQFKNWKCIAVGSQYSNGGAKAIQLYDEADGEPIATATVNLSTNAQKENEVFVKEYSENEGMTQALIDADIIKPDLVQIASSGHVTIKSYFLTEAALQSLW